MLKIVLSIHVDDSLCAVTKEDLEKLYKKVRSKYKITTLREIIKYLGVNFSWRKGEKGRKFVVASMKRNADEIIKFYEKVKKKEAKIAKTPGYQNTVLKKERK